MRFMRNAICFISVPRPQTAQNCGSYNFDDIIKILTEMCCFYQHFNDRKPPTNFNEPEK